MLWTGHHKTLGYMSLRAPQFFKKPPSCLLHNRIKETSVSCEQQPLLAQQPCRQGLTPAVFYKYRILRKQEVAVKQPVDGFMAQRCSWLHIYHSMMSWCHDVMMSRTLKATHIHNTTTFIMWHISMIYTSFLSLSSCIQLWMMQHWNFHNFQASFFNCCLHHFQS